MPKSTEDSEIASMDDNNQGQCRENERTETVLSSEITSYESTENATQTYSMFPSDDLSQNSDDYKAETSGPEQKCRLSDIEHLPLGQLGRVSKAKLAAIEWTESTARGDISMKDSKRFDKQYTQLKKKYSQTEKYSKPSSCRHLPMKYPFMRNDLLKIQNRKLRKRLRRIHKITTSV